jgi:hypothetical protein
LAGVTGAGNNLTLNNTGVAQLNAAQTGLGTLTASGSGTLVVDNTISGAALSDSEVTTLNGTGGSETITTTGGDQDYTGAVTLGANTTLNSGTVELATVGGGGNNLTVNNSGTATLNGAVSGLQSLSISGATELNIDTVTTTGGQSYGGDVTLAAPTTLTGTTLTLGGVTGNGNNLTLNNGGVATLSGPVSGVEALSISGASQLNGGQISTTAGQSYDGEVTLGVATILHSGTTVTLVGVAGDGYNLTLNNGGTATLNGPISGVAAFSIRGASQLNGGTVTTTGGQTYAGDITLGAATTLTGTTVTLSELAGGGYNLTLYNSGTATFNGAVGGVDSLLVTGPSQLNGGIVTTTAGQTYAAISLGAPTRLVGNPVRFTSVDYNGFTLILGEVDLAVTETATGNIFGALQRREKKPKATNPEMDSAPSVTYPSLVPPASSYPALVRGAKG